MGLGEGEQTIDCSEELSAGYVHQDGRAEDVGEGLVHFFEIGQSS